MALKKQVNKIFTKEDMDKVEGSLWNYKTRIVVPEGVEEIADKALSDSFCKEIILPKTLKKIGDAAFSYMDDLEEIVIPDGVESLGRWCFSYCKKLRKISLPKGLKEIGDGCFYYSTKLSSVGSLLQVEKIGIDAFHGTEIKELHLPKTLKLLGERALYSLETVSLYDNVRPFGDTPTLNYTLGNCFYDLEKRPTLITMKSHKTEDLLYEVYYVPIQPKKNKKEGCKSIRLFGEDNSFDFEEYDRIFSEIGSDFLKMTLALMRFRKPHGLTEEARKRYMNYLENFKNKDILAGRFAHLALHTKGIDEVRELMKYHILDSTSWDHFIRLLMNEGAKEDLMIELLQMKAEEVGFDVD